MCALGHNWRGGDDAQFDYFFAFRKKKAVVAILYISPLLTSGLDVCSCRFLQKIISGQISLALAGVQLK